MAYLGDKAVGDIVKIKEDGVAVNYLIVHKGKPSSMYDDSCDGVWVLRQDIYEKKTWDGTNNDYKNSDMHTYLNVTFLNKFDADIKGEIQEVKIPYHNEVGNLGFIASGSSGLSAKIFLLSGYELGWTQNYNSYIPGDGAKLSYFSSGAETSANNKRIAKLNGSATFWWERSPYGRNNTLFCSVDSKGCAYGSVAGGSCGVSFGFCV